MIQTALVIAAAWLFLTALGWVVLAPLPAPARYLLLPSAPLWGVTLLVAVLHDTALFTSVRVGVFAVLAVAFVLLVVAFRRDSRWWRTPRSALAMLGLAAVCGAVPAVWALGPSEAVGDSNVIQPSANNDAFYYVSVIDWLEHHSARELPQIGSTPAAPGVPPAYGPAQAHLVQGLRIGQELTQGAINTTLGRNATSTWYPLTALWVLLLPAAGLGAARFLRMHAVTGLIAGVAVSVSSLTIFQLAAQNSDSLLGICLAPMVIGAVANSLGQNRLVPRPLAGVTLAAWLGTYTEFLPLVAPAFVVAVLLRRPRVLPAALRSAAILLASALVVAPLVWYRAYRSLVLLGSISVDNYPSAFHDATTGQILNRFLGLSTVSAPYLPSRIMPVLATALGIGALAAMVLSRRRWFLLALMTVGPALAWYIIVVRDRPYTQQRIVQLWLPLLLLVVAFGWDRTWRWCAAKETRRAHRPLVAAVTAVAVGTSVVFIGVNSRTDYEMGLRAYAQSRHVDSGYAQAAGWVKQIGGNEGDQAMVLTNDFFTQLWITDALRGEDDIAYPSLFISYQHMTSFWDGRLRRWLLVDLSAHVDAGPGVVVRRNSHFELLDLSKGQALVAVTGDEFGKGSLFVLRTLQLPAEAILTGSTRRRSATDPAVVPGATADGTPLPAGSLTPASTQIDVSLTPASPGTRLLLDDGSYDFDVTGASHE